MSLYSVTPRVKGRWHAPSGQRPVIPRDKNQFFIVYRLDDLIVFGGFLLVSVFGRRNLELFTQKTDHFVKNCGQDGITTSFRGTECWTYCVILSG